MDIYLTDEERNIIRQGLKFLVKNYNRSMERADTDYLKEINRRKLEILAGLDKKI